MIPQVARFGPYNICINGTVTFNWNGMHGLFQIPDIACPSNFTAGAAEGYSYLAPPSNGGSFTWEVPNKTGQYWLTSQWPGDCQNGKQTWSRQRKLMQGDCFGIYIIRTAMKRLFVKLHSLPNTFNLIFIFTVSHLNRRLLN
jgi:hypothetical protein